MERSDAASPSMPSLPGHAKRTMRDLLGEINGLAQQRTDMSTVKNLLKAISGTLNERAQQFVLARYSEGLTYAAISKKHGLSAECTARS